MTARGLNTHTVSLYFTSDSVRILCVSVWCMCVPQCAAQVTAPPCAPWPPLSSLLNLISIFAAIFVVVDCDLCAESRLHGRLALCALRARPRARRAVARGAGGYLKFYFLCTQSVYIEGQESSKIKRITSASHVRPELASSGSSLRWEGRHIGAASAPGSGSSCGCGHRH